MESDWKKFRSMVADWRERYLKEQNARIAGILTNPETTPTQRFWDALDAMEKTSKILRDCLDGHSRSSMRFYMQIMLGVGMLTREDLEDFSPELRDFLLKNDE